MAVQDVCQSADVMGEKNDRDVLMQFTHVYLFTIM